MTALPAADVRHLSVVQDTPSTEGRNDVTAPLVGYVVLVPEGTDPAALLAAQGLHAEVRPVVHTAEPPVPPEPAPSPGGIRTDRVRHTAEVDGRPLELTYLEFQLLDHLTAHPHRVHTRDHLVATLWGYSHVGDGRTVDVHIARLRRKLGPAHRDAIVTVRRVGYKYVPREGGAQAQPATGTVRSASS